MIVYNLSAFKEAINTLAFTHIKKKKQAQNIKMKPQKEAVKAIIQVCVDHH